MGASEFQGFLKGRDLITDFAETQQVHLVSLKSEFIRRKLGAKTSSKKCIS